VRKWSQAFEAAADDNCMSDTKLCMLNLQAHLKGSIKDPRHAVSLRCSVSAFLLTEEQAAMLPSCLTCEDKAVL